MKTAPISVDYLGHYGSDLVVANAARVSFHKTSDWEWGRMLSEKDAKLINYLAKHKHFSPFNHAFLSVRVKAPVLVARQMVKHEYMPFNEVSRRYVDEEPEVYIPKFRSRAANVKQGSGDILGVEDYEDAEWHLNLSNEQALASYNELLKLNVAPEVARSVLPLNLMTEWVWSGTLGAFAKMLGLRLKSDTQEESRDVAKLILPIVEEHFPISIGALLA